MKQKDSKDIIKDIVNNKMKIEDLKLSNSTQIKLQRLGCETVYQLISDDKKIKNEIGIKNLIEINDAIDAIGISKLHLGMSADELKELDPSSNNKKNICTDKLDQYIETIKLANEKLKEELESKNEKLEKYKLLVEENEELENSIAAIDNEITKLQEKITIHDFDENN